MESFWDFIWLTIVIFAFVAYLMVMFQIVIDLIRDHELSGWWKALWLFVLFWAPFLSALVYLIARGKGMAERQMRQVADMQARQEAYIKTVAGGSGAAKSPAEQIADAKALLDSGAINQDEFDTLKAKALA